MTRSRAARRRAERGGPPPDEGKETGEAPKPLPPLSPIHPLGATPSARVHAVLAILLVIAAALAIYFPTPGNYWIRYDNETFIQKSPQVVSLASGEARYVITAIEYKYPEGAPQGP